VKLRPRAARLIAVLLLAGAMPATSHAVAAASAARWKPTLVKDIRVGKKSSDPHELTEMGESVLFAAEDGVFR
jgi:hypothetical protein